MSRTKRIFISDIHMGDDRSMQNQKHYGWFVNNVPILAQFLEDQLNAPDVQEVVILGDLFDEWVIPANIDPLVSFVKITSNPKNGPVINKLKALAASTEIKLSYVPGNHDMSMNQAGIMAVKTYLEATFPGIQFECDNDKPLGKYTAGILAAEHGNRYCLFNAPDNWTTAGETFLPLGYFISRLVAFKVSKTGCSEDYIDILGNFLKQLIDKPGVVLEDLFLSLAKDCGLSENDTFDLSEVPGFPGSLKVSDVGQRFNNLVHNWGKSGNINSLLAIGSDIGKIRFAAIDAYDLEFNPKNKIVIFGHTHIPELMPLFAIEPGHGTDRSRVPSRAIYANCGTWVDQDKDHTCTYVETEEVVAQERHYVRLKNYPKNECLDSGFIKIESS